MDVFEKLSAHYGVPFPAGYQDWSRKGYTDYQKGDGQYLWAFEAEWIPPEEIPSRDLWRVNIIPGLIPFAFSGAGDNWCWNTSVVTSEAEYEVMFCYHDEELADVYAPNFAAWFYRTCLDFASGGFDDEEDAMEYLELWSKRLAEIHDGDWADHLAKLAETEPFDYEYPGKRKSLDMRGFITVMEVEEIVATQFGRRYLEEKVAWGEYE